MFLRMIALTLAAMSAGAQQPELSKGVDLHSKEKEARLGAIVAEEFRKNSRPLASATVRAYVERLGAQLATQAPEGSGPCRFEVVADHRTTNSVNEAFVLPGGYVFVPADLLLAAKDEAEFAGMLAHAVAHVAARHATRTSSRESITIAIPLGFSDADVPMTYRRFVRGYELEADLLAVPIMARAGFDPSALIRYIQRVQRDPPASGAPFSALPARDERVAALENAIAFLPAREYAVGSDFARIQEDVRRAASITQSPNHPITKF
jgi:beta-barrel assembly-enhancing protease